MVINIRLLNNSNESFSDHKNLTFDITRYLIFSTKIAN